MASTSWLKSGRSATWFSFDPIKAGAPAPYPGWAIVQLCVGDVNAHWQRCRGSLDPANPIIWSAGTSSISATVFAKS